MLNYPLESRKTTGTSDPTRVKGHSDVGGLACESLFSNYTMCRWVGDQDRKREMGSLKSIDTALSKSVIGTKLTVPVFEIVLGVG